MKAYELIESTPNEINGFKRLPSDEIYKELKEDFSFELNTEEENSFYETLEIGWDDKQFLWYENDKRAYSLFVTLNDDREVEFQYYYMEILWKDDDGETEYDALDVGYLEADSFEEAVLEFLSLL